MCVGFQFGNVSLFFYQSVCAVREFPFNITHSRSEIELSGLLKCLATGSSLLLSLMFFFVIVHTESNDGRCFTYVVV